MTSTRSLACLLLFASALLVPVVGLAEGEEVAVSPTLKAIDDAAAAGEITEAEAILYKVLAVKRSGQLPVQFQRDETFAMKCATQVLEDARRSLATMPGEIRSELEGALARPVLPEFIDTAHFRIHYSTNGGNVIYQWPNTSYRDAVMAACEASWSYIHVTKTWPAPPSDGAAGGGSGLIDCYVDALSGVYGWTMAENPAGGGYPDDWTAYFVIDNDYAGFGYADRTVPMKVTVAHEYHHVVQMGMKANGAGWFMENTSTFIEDEVYDSINDNYQYMPCYFGAPWTRLNTMTGCFEYACFIWPTYISENWDHSVVREIWHDFATQQNLYTAFDNELGIYGETLDSGVAEWVRWNVFTRDRNDGNHYIEGGAYQPQVNYDGNYNTYPLVNVHPSAAKKPQGLGTNYTRFRPAVGSTDNKIEVTYQGPSCSYSHEISFVRKFLNEAVWEEYVEPVDASGQATFEMLRWDETEYMFLVVPMKRACGAIAQDFTLNAVTSQQPTDVADGAIPARVIRLDQNRPNPFYPQTTIHYALSEAGPVDLSIFDASGRHVRTLVRGNQPAGEHQVRWLGSDDAGKMLPVGVYFYTLRANGAEEVRKMLLLE